MVGGFDGYFIIKYLYHYTKDPKLVDLMLDKNNKFIKITLSESYKSKGKINRRELFTFKDSMRLLGGVSLNTLCKIYGVTQKLCEYKPIWNTLSLFLDTTPLRGKRVTESGSLMQNKIVNVFMKQLTKLRKFTEID